MAARDLKQIQRTSEVETNNEAVGVKMKEGRATDDGYRVQKLCNSDTRFSETQEAAVPANFQKVLA